MDWQLILEIFGSFCVIIGGLYGVASKLISVYFSQKQEKEDSQFKNIEERIKHIDLQFEEIEKKAERLKDGFSSALDSRVNSLMKEIKDLAEEIRGVVTQLAVSDERAVQVYKHFEENSSNLTKLMHAMSRRYSQIESQQVKISEDLIMIKERVKGK